jgi:hypothetical protein
MRIPLPDTINPGAIQGDRLSMNAPNIAAPAQALQGLGNAVSGLAQTWQAEQDKMDHYNANLTQEKWQTDTAINYQKNLETSAPDGSDFPQKHEDYLLKSYEATLKNIKNPEDQQRFTMLFERTRGNQVVRAMNDAKQKGESYVKATTGDSINEAVKSGSITTDAEYNDYLENVVKPRIDQYISDPLERKKTLSFFSGQMRSEFLKRNPQVAMPKATRIDGMSDYKTRLRQIESGGNDRAYNKDSGAAGRYQIIPSTQRQYGVTDPFDEGQQEAFVERFTAQNRSFLRSRLGREPSAGELYLAHQQGAGGASRLLANPGAKAVDIVGTKAVTLNGGNTNMSAQEFANLWINKFEGVNVGASSVSYSPATPPSGPMWDDMDVGEWQQYTTAGQKAFKESLDLGIVQGTVERDDILNSPLDDGDTATLLRSWESENKDKIALTALADRLDNGLFINAKDPENRKGAGLLLDQAGGPEAVAAGDPAAVQAMYDIYDKAGIVPDNAKGAMESMLRSKNPAQVNTALSYLSELKRRSPRTFDMEFDASTAALVENYRKGLDYTTPAESANRVMQDLDPAQEATRREREKEGEKQAAKLSVDTVMDKVFDPSYFPFTQAESPIKGSDAESAMMADYRNLYVEAYKATGNDAEAQKIAAQRLQSVWAPSKANRDIVMRYPPEVLYGEKAMINGSYDWMKTAIEKELVEAGYFTEDDTVIAGGKGGALHGTKKTPLKYFLVADDKTRMEANVGRPPSYIVTVINEDGAYDVVPKRMWFDVDAAKRQNEVTQGIMRERNKQRRMSLEDELARQRKEGVAPIPGKEPDFTSPMFEGQ